MYTNRRKETERARLRAANERELAMNENQERWQVANLAKRMRALPKFWTDQGSDGSDSRKQSISSIKEEEEQNDAMPAVGNGQNNGSMQTDPIQNEMDNGQNAENHGQAPPQQQQVDSTAIPQTAVPQRQPPPKPEPQPIVFDQQLADRKSVV